LKKENFTYKEARWHLLRVDKNGSLRPFVHFRGLAIIVAGLIFVMAGVIGWLLVAWLDTRASLVASQKSASMQTRAVETIRHEKDSAMARLAIAESKLKAVVSRPPTEKQTESLASNQAKKTPVKTVTEPKGTPQVPPVKKPAETAKTPGAFPAADADMEMVIEKVIADNLFICASPDDRLLNIEFKVINMGTRTQPVSGHVFVILKDAHAEQDQWLVVPRAMLMDGRPVQSKGQKFRIYNYRTIKSKVAHENPGLFVQATIFIFKNTGELIFERDYTLEPIRVCS